MKKLHLTTKEIQKMLPAPKGQDFVWPMSSIQIRYLAEDLAAMHAKNKALQSDKPVPKMFIWERWEGHSWERIMVVADDLEQAQQMAIKSQTCSVTGEHCPGNLEISEPTEVRELPTLIYDVY